MSLLRRFRRSPTYSGVTVLVLGLGTAAALTVYTVLDAVVLRRCPMPRPIGS